MSDNKPTEHTVNIDDIKNGILPWHMMMQNSIEATEILNKMRNNTTVKEPKDNNDNTD